MADKNWQRVLNAEVGMVKRRAESIVHSVNRGQKVKGIELIDIF